MCAHVIGGVDVLHVEQSVFEGTRVMKRVCKIHTGVPLVMCSRVSSIAASVCSGLQLCWWCGYLCQPNVHWNVCSEATMCKLYICVSMHVCLSVETTCLHCFARLAPPFRMAICRLDLLSVPTTVGPICGAPITRATSRACALISATLDDAMPSAPALESSKTPSFLVP